MMQRLQCRARAAILALALVLGWAPALAAQGIEVTPLAGYRFGGDFFEIVTRQPVDLDGALALGLVVDFPLSNGLQVEGLFSHEQAHVTTANGPLLPATPWRITVDHWMGGALQEFDGGRARPFLTGMLGLTRYGSDSDNELRFTLSSGGGVKLLPTPWVGLRLEGRVFATFVDADGRAIACSSISGFCLFGLNTDVVWQAEFTAGVVFKLP